MSTRSRIVAAQAVLVGVLLVVVFVTLLKPEGHSSLVGVHGPAMPTTEGVTGTPGSDPDGDGDRRGGGGGKPGGEPPGAGSGAIAGGSTGTAAAPGAIAPRSRGPRRRRKATEGSPADQQYADTLARLNAALY